jgi:hypothetical protein
VDDIMELVGDFLVDAAEAWQLPPTLHACWNAKGLYEPLKFVLRLRPDIHNELATTDEAKKAGKITSSQIEAFSTYFHETIHWWQHVGSTYGLVASLLHPAQCHVNYRDLKAILQLKGPIKSLKQFNLTLTASDENRELRESVNRVLNNWHDIEFFRWLTFDPARAEKVVRDPYFECIGHSYEIAVGSVLWLLSATFDPTQEIVPDPHKWEAEFKRLRESNFEDFHYGSDIHLPPIGAREIFEGQARFCQIQYLYEASGRAATWEIFSQLGMLSGFYRTAFDLFLNVTGATWPTSPRGSVVGLFLLICDLAINPGEGFPLPIIDYSCFVWSTDPGHRFLALCYAVKKDVNLLEAISDYSKDEYENVSHRLSAAIVSHSPMAIARAFAQWTSQHKGAASLLLDDSTFEYQQGNLPVRVFVGRFLSFQRQKLRAPEFFCWPGVWATERDGLGRLAEFEQVFEEHRALFLDRSDGDVYPRTFRNRAEGTVQAMFDEFYSWTSTYDLTRQWIVGEGPFEIDFGWLTTKFSREEMTEWASRNFSQTYGVSPSAFSIL